MLRKVIIKEYIKSFILTNPLTSVVILYELGYTALLVSLIIECSNFTTHVAAMNECQKCTEAEGRN